jgi:type I protein arginine methyltransferase
VAASEDNQSMTDESKPLSNTKEEEKKNDQPKKKPNNRKNGQQKERKPFEGPLKEPHFKDKFRPMKSYEPGYTGDSELWFDEEKYRKPKGKANFDGANKHDYYFNSYSSHHIHEEMLKDTSRTLTYQRAIEGNPQDFKDKIVLDIGCGTGILSIFAARAGAKHVYAVDNAEIALFAQEIVNENGFKDKITIIKGKMEEIEFPFGEGEVDIIISEWMGYFLLYESMLDCVLWARDKYLNKKTGKMLPDRAQLYVAAIEDSEYMGEKTSFWKNVYGVNMSVMTQGIFVDPMVDTVPTNNIMSDHCCVLDLDLVKMKKE